MESEVEPFIIEPRSDDEDTDKVPESTDTALEPMDTTLESTDTASETRVAAQVDYIGHFENYYNESNVKSEIVGDTSPSELLKEINQVLF